MTKKLKALLENERYGEILRFALGGVLTTAVNFLVYIPAFYLLFSPALGETFGSVVANLLAWVLAVLFAFFINKHLVFKSKTDTRRGFLAQLFTFYATRAASGALEILLPALLIYLGMNNLLAKIAVSVLILVTNYFTSKFLAFRKK